MVTTIAQTSSLPQTRHTEDELKDLQTNFGASCARYEELTAKTQKRDTSTIIVSGYGYALRVTCDRLDIFPGKSYANQRQTTESVYCGLREKVERIVLLSDKGLVTLDAVKWCEQMGIALTMIDRQGHRFHHREYPAISTSISQNFVVPS